MLSDAGRQRVHRQQDNGQDEHAADGGTDPGFHSLVHAAAAAVKRHGGRCRRCLGHGLHSLGLVELCSPSGRNTIKLRKTPELKCRSFMKSIALAYAHPGGRGPLDASRLCTGGADSPVHCVRMASRTSAPIAGECGRPRTVTRFTSRQNSGSINGRTTTSDCSVIEYCGMKAKPNPAAVMARIQSSSPSRRMSSSPRVH